MRTLLTTCCLSLLLCIGCGVGCAASEPVPASEKVPGVPTSVQIVDGSHVRYEDRRVPTEAFLYDMRVRVRCAASRESLPAVKITFPDDASEDLTRVMDRIVRELWIAGVRNVALGDGP